MQLREVVFFFWRYKSFWIRALLCWAVGIAMIWSDEKTNFDTRLQLRGNHLKSDDIALVLISESDWTAVSGPRFNLLRPLKEVGYLTDSYFWHEETWVMMLNQLLKLDPRAIGVSFFFGDNIGRISENPVRLKVFEDKRIVWSARFDPEGRAQLPKFARMYDENVGMILLQSDFDGFLRSVSSPLSSIPHFAIRLADLNSPRTSSFPNRQDLTINYQGPPGSFHIIPFLQLVEGKVSLSEVQNKIIIIGSKDSVGHLILTPVGMMTKAEVLANITDNIIHQRWVDRLDNKIYYAALLLLLALSLWIIFSYPQLVALIGLGFLGAIIATVSTWMFDSFYLYIPILSPLVQLISTFVVFQSYQLSLNEQKAWMLEQERLYSSEIEKLKDNFISLISHDLKTPIAKIQAVADRMLRTHVDESLQKDLAVMRNTSQDLYRYIQSILRVTKVEAHEFRIRKEAIDINDLIMKAIDILLPLAQEKNIQIHHNLEPLFSVEIDADLIQECILNLLENAIKYTPSGRGVTITSKEVDDAVVVVIKDTGEGISQDEQDLIWNKFYRGRQHGLTVPGTGLGLYLVKYFIELHGGRVFLQSAPGKGTEVGFAIPVQPQDVTISR